MKLLLLILILHIALLCLAQNSSIPKELRCNHLFIKDGLIEGQINSLFQDTYGYTWIGTTNGIVRYDGYKPKNYFLQKSGSKNVLVGKIFEDAKRELWIGTALQGLYHYDRRIDSFINYRSDPADKNSITNGDIYRMTDDGFGNLWINIVIENKTKEVLDCFNLTTKKFTHYSQYEKGKNFVDRIYFSPLVKDKKGNFWCGSNNGLLQYDYVSKSFVSHFASTDSSKQPDFVLTALDSLNPDVLWASVINDFTGKRLGLWQCNLTTHEIKKFPHDSKDSSSLANDEFQHILIDKKGNLWISGYKSLSVFHPSTQNFTNYYLDKHKEKDGQYHMQDCVEGESGNLWISSSIGLYLFDVKKRKFIFYACDQKGEDGLRYYYDPFVDRMGNLWLPAGGGVQWINKRKSRFSVYEDNPGQPHQFNGGFVYAFAEASDKTIWLATDKGLYHWKPSLDSFQHIRIDKDYPTGLLFTVMVDENGKVWCGGDGQTAKGIYCYDPVSKQVTNYRNKEKDSTTISENRLVTIYRDHLNNIWIGTWGGGLCKFNKSKRTFTRYPYVTGFTDEPEKNKLDDNEALSICQDKNGVLWVGSNSGGLNRLNSDGTFTSFFKKSEQFQCVIRIYEDSKSRLWAGSYMFGLLEFDRNKETSEKFTEKDGLLYGGVSGILEDKAGNLWLKSARGVTVFNPDTKTVRNFTDDVLQEESFRFSSFKTSDDLFLFPNHRGFVTVNPDDFAPDSITPIVHIEAINFTKPKTRNKTQDSTIIRYGKPNISLHYNENRVTFNYVGLLYQNTSQIQYKYRLDGYDNDWIQAGPQRTVTYTNLDPGTYTFHVTAANSDGIWSLKEDSITITIGPPFWATWWFRLAAILSAAGLIFLAVKQYLKRKLKMQQLELERLTDAEKIRSKISMDLHDEISSGLTKISLLSQRIKARFEKDNTVDSETVDKIAGSSREVIGNLGEIIWAINPTHDNLPSLLAYIRNYVVSFFEATDIEAKVCFPDDVPSVAVSPDIKHNVFLVIKEVLNNIIKHAGATQTDVRFTFTDDAFSFTITDNGRGLPDENKNAFGNGLINMRNRMQAIGGTVTIQSAEGKGTAVLLRGTFIQEKGKPIL